VFMVLLAGFQALLARWTGGDDVAVGTPVANRARPETEPLIGFFVNTLVLRTDLSGDPTLAQLLAQVRRVALDAYTHQELPFERLVEDLAPQRDLARHPLFQVMLSYETAEETPAREQVGDSEARGVPVELIETSLDLILALADDRGGLEGRLEYSVEL